MNIQWDLILNSAWTVFWVTTLYSYLSCGLVGTLEGFRTKGKMESVDAKIEAFVISPFYVATFFVMFCLLFFWQGLLVARAVPADLVVNVAAVGLAVFVGHTLIELAESTFVRKNPLRILQDHDALRLAAIYLMLIAATTAFVAYVRPTLN